MMNEKEIEQIFENLNGSFDVNEPAEGHRERFIAKMNSGQQTIASRPVRSEWWRALSVAASIAVICVLAMILTNPEPSVESQVSQIAPEASQTQLYFAGLIEEQIRELEAVKSPKTETLVADTMAQLRILEEDYNELETELLEGGNSNLILKAMVTNFQTRIDLLEEVLAYVETINNLNTTNDENITI